MWKEMAESEAAEASGVGAYRVTASADGSHVPRSGKSAQDICRLEQRSGYPRESRGVWICHASWISGLR
jgi:hypothetical protein